MSRRRPTSGYPAEGISIKRQGLVMAQFIMDHSVSGCWHQLGTIKTRRYDGGLLQSWTNLDKTSWGPPRRNWPFYCRLLGDRLGINRLKGTLRALALLRTALILIVVLATGCSSSIYGWHV